MPPGTINRPKSKALKVRREKIRTKKKLSSASEKHKKQVELLKTRNPKRERKLAKRKAALERAAAAEGKVEEQDVMADVKPAKAAKPSKKAKRQSASGGDDEMQE
ncbi:hypothetical protein PLESTB_000460100 [Pleodorina starrii]|uniref:Uncharacterized protein n=1 Tax=Pleodorina starrii TaxID=330485 RepID=A0A9W6F074_9CHLO|nr:hypothetical protein PLESTM_000794500 [Pleodorina starrii]GLC51045.1 hypothetical protein PLESTB_000460100 [Pleodorina starrii]GLC63406.1 hypothetical protein PLESTF_000032900 [Pleodorina starrii]